MAYLSHNIPKSYFTINLKHIFYTPQNPGSKKPYKERLIGRQSRFLKGLSFKRILTILLLLALPIYVSAGLIGILSSFFSQELMDSNVPSVVNMKILTAAISPSDDAYNVDMMVDDSALLSAVSLYQTGETHIRASDQISIYVVREDDTLSQIAKMFNVSVNTIKWNNDLSGNVIKPGQTLIILPISGVKHIVIKGETLATIAKKYKGDIDEITGYNELSEDSPLAVGTEIIIPDGEIVSSSGSLSKPVYGTGLKEFVGFYLRPIVGGKKTQGLHGYNGIDLGAPVGTPIMASASGEVIISRVGGWNGGYGNYVVIKHSNGTQTLYAHNSRNAVSAGESVKQGQVIGYIGTTGKATGPHVHFEIRGAKNPF